MKTSWSVRVGGGVLLLSAVLTSLPAFADVLEGRVSRVAGTTLLIESEAGKEIVAIGPGATVTGSPDYRRLSVGHRVRVEYSRERAGVKIAEAMHLDPIANTDPRYWIEIGEFRQLFDGGKGPSTVAVLDARPRARFDTGHLPGALSAPADDPMALRQALPESRDAQVVFYSEGPRCDLAQRAVRQALRLGYTEVRSLRGGLPTWVATRGYLIAEVPAGGTATRGVAKGYLAVDVRDRTEEDRQTLPGAVSVPLESMDRADFLGEAWMPPFLLVGANAHDERPFQAAEKIAAWRSTDAVRSNLPVYVLAGGVAAWKSAGRATEGLANAPTSIGIRSDAIDGAVSFAEYSELWRTRETTETILLDVRSPLETPKPATTFIPLEHLHERIEELPKEREIVSFCYTGNRSAIAHLMLTRLGYRVRYLPAPPEVALASNQER